MAKVPVDERRRVRINIYEKSVFSSPLSRVGMGIHHSGIEVYGDEYVYGASKEADEGISVVTPHDASDFGEQFKFKESIPLGYTTLTKQEVQAFVRELSREFRGDQYHLFTRNCNHFSSALSKRLCGRDIPDWVNRLASHGGKMPFLERWLPKECFPTATVVQPTIPPVVTLQPINPPAATLEPKIEVQTDSDDTPSPPDQTNNNDTTPTPNDDPIDSTTAEPDETPSTSVESPNTPSSDDESSPPSVPGTINGKVDVDVKLVIRLL